MNNESVFMIVPKFAWNDYAGSGTTKSGRLICTHKFVFMLIEKEDFSKNLMYDQLKVENLINVAESVDIIDFETELLEIIPQQYIFRIENMESFNITNNFFVGGMSFQIKGQDVISFEIAKRDVRKELQAFYKGKTT